MYYLSLYHYYYISPNFGTFTNFYNDLSYSDITNCLINVSTEFDYVSMIKSYGVVGIVISVKSNSQNLLLHATIGDKRYYPLLQYTNGTYASMSSVVDKNKFNAANINTDGLISIWLSDKLSYAEKVYFCYPIKR